MKLVHLSIENLKNHTRTSLDLPPLVALHGENGAGKSAVITAIKLGVLGHDPDIGKTLELTRQLVQVGSDRAKVALTFDNGFAIERRFGASRETRVIPPKGERTEDEAKARIERETGKFLVSFDLGAFLSLSAQKRCEWLLNTLPRESVNLDETMWRLRLGYEVAEEAIKAAIDKLWKDRVLAEQSLIDGLASAIKYTNEQVNQAERDRRAQVSVWEDAEQEAVTMSRRATADPARLRDLQEELERVQRQLGELREKRESFERADRAVREREHNERVIRGRLQAAAQHVDRVQEEIDSFDDTPVPDLAALEREQETAERKARAQRDVVAQASEKRASTDAQIRDLKTRLEALQGRDQCPVCGSISQPDRVRPALEDQLNALTDAQRDAADAQTQEEQEQRRLEERAAELKLQIRAADADIRKRDQAKNDLRIARMVHDGVVAELRRFQEQAVSVPEAPSEEEMVALSRRAVELRADVDLEQQKLKEAGKAEGARERAHRAQQELQRRTNRVEALKALYVAQQKLRSEVIRSMVGPVEETANEILKTIDETKTFKFIFERENKDEFDFGFEQSGIFRSYDAASTGEDAALAVVLVAALIAAVKPKWSVLLIDNAESIDELRRRDLMRALAQLSDRFDNVVMAGCCEFDGVGGWQVIRMRDGAAVAAQAAA